MSLLYVQYKLVMCFGLFTSVNHHSSFLLDSALHSFVLVALFSMVDVHRSMLLLQFLGNMGDGWLSGKRTWFDD